MLVGKVDQVRLRVEDGDVDDVSVKGLAQLLDLIRAGALPSNPFVSLAD